MEDWLNQVNAVLQSMQKTLECNICLDLLNKPLTTKCGHSFCADCIHQLVKNARNTAQCPLCLCHVTRRSLGQNSKITGLVVSVRDIIASIKKDCCFEVTPSKYRPRRQPVVPYEEDDSENEENDEPRRGMRKRAVTSHYNPEVYVPKPRVRAAKQRILASSSGQELNLCVDGKTEMTETTMTPMYGEPSLISCIEKEHSYSSPTKQEPHERSSVGQQIKGQSSRGKGKVSSYARGKSRAIVTKSDKPAVKMLQDYTRKVSSDDHLSASQQDDNVLKFDDGVLSAKEKPSDGLSNKLDHEKSSDKVAKWICNSSEVGFSIGIKQSSESMSTVDSEATHTFQGMNEKESEKPISSFRKTLGCNDSLNPSMEMSSKTCGNVASSHSLSEKEQTSDVLSSKPKFFKSKIKDVSAIEPKEFDKKNFQGFDEDDIATVLYEAKPNIRGTPDDPYKFIPSQKTPKQKVQAKRGRSTRGTKSRARGSLNVSRGRVRGRGRGVGTPGQTVLGMRRDSVAEFGLASSSVFHTQSTPAIKGKGNMQDIDISIIKATDVTIEKKVPNESTIVCRREDDDDDEDCSQIPDSCPVNTKDEFDEVMSGVKERAADLVKGCNDDDSDDEEERHLLFITPAQADENPGPKDTNAQDKEAESKTERIQKKNELERTGKGKPKQRENILSKRKQTSNKLSKSGVENISNSDVGSRGSNMRHHNTSQRKSAAEKAKTEVDALCALFDDVDQHELSTITLEEEEKERKSIEKSKEIVMRQNISIHDQTIENTELNKTMPSINPKPEVSMPPPKAPSRNRKVKFLSSVSNAHSVPGTGDDVTVATSKSERKPLGSRGSGKGKAVKSNVRYGAEAKQKVLEPSKVVPKSVSIKDTKSPGWSHVAGARKDLGTRHTSLNITGGEQRNLNDTKTESGTHNYSVRIPSSEESNMTIDDETQDNNVEHLQSSQSKIELVKKLKEIVKQLKEVGDGDKKVPEIFEKEIPGDVKELMEEQQEMEDLHMENTTKKIDSNEPDAPQNNLQPIYPGETEPFDCSDLVSHPPVKKCTSSVSNVDTLTQKRKAVEDSQQTQSVRPSKLARKTFSLEEKSTISSHSDKPHESSVKHVEKSEIDSRCVERSQVDAPSTVSKSQHSQISDDHLSGISIDLKSQQKDGVMTSKSQSSMDNSGVPSTEVNTVDRISSSSEQVSGSFVFPHNKNHVLPHAMSPSVTTTTTATTAQGHCSEGTADYTFTSDGVNHVLDAKSRVIPFKSVGSLYTKRCGTSSENAQQSRSGGGLGRDLCLHSIPCELYHVLLKYVNVLAAQQQQQSGCCNLPGIECKEAPYTHSKGPLKSDTDENWIIGNNTHLQQSKSTADGNVEIDANEKKPENDENSFDSDVPNSCDTEELKMVIPLPQTMIVKRGSIKEKGMDNHSKERASRNTRNKLVCAQKIDTIADSDSIPQYKDLTGANTRSCEVNDNNLRTTRSGSETDQSKSEISSVSTQAGHAKSKSSGQPTESVASVTSIESQSSRSSQEIPVVDNLVQKNPKQVYFEESTSCERDTEKDCCQGVDEYIPSSCEIESSQKSTSLLSAAEMSNIKATKSNRSSSMADISDAKADEKSGKSDRSQQSQRNREKIVSAKTAVSVGDVEKENLKNRDNLQVNINRPKRKPLQSGPPDLENIMSHVIKGSKSPLDEKIESSQIQRHLSQASLKSSSQRPINSRSLAPNTLNQSNRSFKEGTSYTDKNLNIIDDIEVLESRNSLRASGGSPQRKFMRIKRPVSGSSSEDSDSEGSSAKTKKRKLKVISSSSGTSLSAKVTTSETNGDQHQAQHILDSDEMRDMERFDQNVWDYFGHPDKDMEMKENKEGSQVIIKDSSQPDKVDELIPSDEEIPSTADVMRNVEADLALISKMRQNKEDSQLTINLASQDTDQTSQSTKNPSLSMNTKSLFKKVDKSLTAAENLLEGEDTLFQDLCTPSLEKKGTDIRKLDAVEKSKSSSRDDNATKGDCNEKVVAESDEESEGDLDNVSHSSAHSSQSEAICTQRQQEVQSEVEILRAKIRELEAEKKETSKQDSDAVVPIVNQKKSQDSEDELFPSLPDFNASTEPSLPPSNRPGNSTRLPTKSAPVSVREACRLVCTGLNGSETMKVNDFIKSLAPAGSSIQKAWGTGITHVVVKTDKDMLAQRTLKYLFGVASGCWVVSLQWIIDSISAKKIVEESDYEVLDCTGIPGPRRGRTYFKPIFDNCEFFLKPPFVEVTIGQLKDLLELCGAKLSSSPSGFSKNRSSMKLVIVQTDSSHDAEGYLKKYQKVSVTHDWIIECVGMHSHVCITPYIVGNPKQSHYTSSGIPALLLEESQDLTCSQLP